MKKAIMYIRRSTDMQEASLEDQRQTILKYAESKDYKIVTEFCDDAISGKTVEARPAFQKMLKFARSNAEKEYALLVYDVSRFGRFENPKEAVYWEVELEKHNIHVDYITEGFSNDGSLGSYITKVVKDAEASEYIKKLAKLTKRGIKSCAERGYWTPGKAPFGYMRAVVDPTTSNIEQVLKVGEQNAIKGKRIKLIPDCEEKIEVLKKIFDLYANHEQGLQSILKYLNCNNIPNPSGKKYWYRSTIRTILKNPVYIGIVSLHRGKDEEIMAEDSHEAIIDKELFLKVQERLEKTQFGKRGGYTSPYILTTLIQCEQCGQNLHGTTDRRRIKAKQRGYRCLSNSSQGKHVCQSPRYPATLLEQPVIHYIQSQICNLNWKQQVKKAFNYVLREDENSITTKLQESQREYKQNKIRIQNLLEAIADGLPRETAIHAIQEFEKKQTNLEELIIQIETKKQAGAQYKQKIEDLDSLPNQWKKQFEQVTYQEKKKLVKHFLDKATINHETATMTYYFYEFPNLAEDTPPNTIAIEKKIKR